MASSAVILDLEPFVNRDSTDLATQAGEPFQRGSSSLGALAAQSRRHWRQFFGPSTAGDLFASLLKKDPHHQQGSLSRRAAGIGIMTARPRSRLD